MALPIVPILGGLGLLWLLWPKKSGAATTSPPTYGGGGALGEIPQSPKPTGAGAPKPNVSDVEPAPDLTGVVAGSARIDRASPQIMALDYTGNYSRWTDLGQLNPQLGPIVSSESVAKEWATRSRDLAGSVLGEGDFGSAMGTAFDAASSAAGAAVGAGAEGGATIPEGPRPPMEFPQTYRNWFALYLKGESINLPASWKQRMRARR